MPPKIVYASLSLEILCITRTTVYLISMVKRVDISLVRMKK